MFRWRHLANSSDRLFNVLSQSDFNKDSFSSRQRLHLEQPAGREGTHMIFRDECPLQGKCLTKSIFYIKAEITPTDAGEKKKLIGMTVGIH